MVQEILSYFKPNAVWTLVITVIITVFAWLYKEFKGMLEKDNQNKITLLQKKLDLYSSTEAAIAQVIHRPDDSNAIHNLYNKLGESSSYFSESLREVVRTYYKQADPSMLMILLNYIKAETIELYKKKNKWMEQENSTDLMDKIMKLMNPIWPMLLTIFLVIVSVYVLIVTLEQNNILDAISVYVSFLTIMFSVTAIIANLLVFLEKNKLNLKGQRWVYTIVIILAPALIYWGGRFSFATIAVQIVCMVLLVKTKKPSLIVI